jgi:hypothetical protein
VNGDNGTAQGAAQQATIASGSTVIKADAISAQAAVTCSAGSPALSGQASVGNLSINGNSVLLTGGPQDIPTPAGTLHVDAAYSPGSNVRHQRALWLQTSAGDIIVDEAAVGYVNQPCVNGSPPPPPTVKPALGCRGIAVQYNGGANFVANFPVVPCASAQSSGADFTTTNSFTSVSSVYANTSSSPDPIATSTPYPQGTTVAARAGSGSADIGSGLSVEIKANTTGAAATGVCFNHAVALTSSSQVHGLQVGGTAIADSTVPTDIALAGGATLHVNWYYTDGSYVERRALWLQGATLGQDVVIGDVIAGANDTNPC